MCKLKKVPIVIPDGVPWPADVPIPEIEVLETTVRITEIGEDGKTREVEKTVELPVIPEKNPAGQ